MGAFLLRGSAGSPTSTAPALLVTFVQNRSTCSSPRIPLSVSTASSTYTTLTFMAEATCAADFNSSCWRVSAVVRPIWPRTCSGICSFETKCREFLPSSPYRARSTSLASSGVDRSTVQLLVMLPRASTFIVHLVWHIVRTPILPLSSGRPIFSLIRRNISSFWDEYFISVFVWCRHRINTAPCFSMPLAVTFNARLSKCG